MLSLSTMNITTEWIQKVLQKRAGGLEKHLSSEFCAQLDSRVEKKILECKARVHTPLREQKDNSLRSFFKYFMKKQSAIMLGVGTVAVLMAVLAVSTQSRRARVVTTPELKEIDILLASVSTDPKEIEQTLSDIDGLDESLDQEPMFNEEPAVAEPTQPPSTKSPTDNKDKEEIKKPSVDTSSLDAFLGEMDQLKTSSDTSLSDLDALDENEDNIII